LAVKLVDPLGDAQAAFNDPLSIIPRSVPKALTPHPKAAAGTSIEKVKEDFRLFVILIWRHLLGVDPAPIMLDMAYWLQHGPDRSIIMAFRGFSKSWITGAYALWRLWRNPQHKVMVVSGSLTRAIATTNWCLALINEMPLLASLKPRPEQRQSSKAFDVGPATPSQSPSFFALGIGGQAAGWRADLIIPDDVETQQNSITVTMREKNREAVKEFDSIILPGGQVKYLGTPHDEDSLYNQLEKAGYTTRIWPALFPTSEQLKKYGHRIAPYITRMMAKLGPSCVGKSVMPSRFTDEDLAKRRLSIGNSEFQLQFMLDTSLSDRDKYPLKLAELMVLKLDPRKAPESLAWTGEPHNRIPELPVMGFEGDHYHRAVVPSDVTYSRYTKVIGAIDSSGRGSNEAALVILGELYGNLFWLHLDAHKAGYDPATLLAFAKALVRFNANEVHIESNFGDGMFAQLFRPVLEAEWAKENERRRKAKRAGAKVDSDDGGTEVVEVRASNQMNKERRILAILEPVTQSHRLVVNRDVIEWDFSSLEQIEGSETRHKYAWGYQFTHLTREKDSLLEDDRLDALAIGVAAFGDIIGVDPELMARRAVTSRMDEELEKLLEDDEENLGVSGRRANNRAEGLRPQAR
jgi:hypothetical protein